MASCNDCIHAEMCSWFMTASDNLEICDAERIANNCDEFCNKAQFKFIPKHLKEREAVRKEMTNTQAVIILDRLNTTERIDVDRVELVEAVKKAKYALRKQIAQPLGTRTGKATDGSGNEMTVRQPCCPRCGGAIFNAAQRHINFCPTCGQAIEQNQK